MKYLKRILIILIIFMIIIIGGIICIISVEKNNSELNEENAGDAGESLQVNKSVLENVTDKDRFFTVRNCVQQFLDKINDNNSNYFSTDEEGNQIKILEDNQIKQSRYNMLSSKFIEKNNITVANINNNLKTMNSKVIFDALDIKYLKGVAVARRKDKNIDSFNDLLTEIKEVDLLVIDDFGNEHKNEIIRDMIVFPLLNERMKNNKLTCFTSPYSLSDLVSMYSLKEIRSPKANQLKEIIEIMADTIKLESLPYRE